MTMMVIEEVARVVVLEEMKRFRGSRIFTVHGTKARDMMPTNMAHVFTLSLMIALLPQLVSSLPPSALLLRGNIVENSATVNVTLPDYNVYHRSDALLKEVSRMVERHPQIMSLDVLQSDSDGYSTEISVVTVVPGGREVSPNGSLRILLDFGQHGRELVTSEVALRFLSMLGGEYSLGTQATASLFLLLPQTVIKIIPLENVNGRKKVEAGDLCERKNGRGVDPNRNWGIDWGKKEKDYDPKEEFPGTTAFSEPETRILQQLASSFKPHLWVNVHSGMEALFMPYDHRKMVPNDGGAEAMQVLLQTLNRLHCNNSCVVGSGGSSVGYLAHGTATDYMYDALRVPVALTFEIYGDTEASSEDCFRMFNPITPANLEVQRVAAVAGKK